MITSPFFLCRPHTQSQLCELFGFFPECVSSYDSHLRSAWAAIYRLTRDLSAHMCSMTQDNMHVFSFSCLSSSSSSSSTRQGPADQLALFQGTGHSGFSYATLECRPIGHASRNPAIHCAFLMRVCLRRLHVCQLASRTSHSCLTLAHHVHVQRSLSFGTEGVISTHAASSSSLLLHVSPCRVLGQTFVRLWAVPLNAISARSGNRCPT